MIDQIIQLNSLFSDFNIAAICQNYAEVKNFCYYDVKLLPRGRIRLLEKCLPELSLALHVPVKLQLKTFNEQGMLRLSYVKEAKTSKVSLFNLGYGLPRPVGKLTCLLGETPEGSPLWFDLADCPHLLVAGTSGSGKSSLLHSLIANLLLHRETFIILMDPKNIEFYQYQTICSDRISVSFKYEECLSQIEGLCLVMEERYHQIRDLKISASSFPFIVLIIDEFADLMLQDTSKRFHAALCKLSQKSRAAGIHIVLSTQRPSVDVVDGTIKANFPARIACKVSSGVDSRVILDANGAQHLLGCGDALLKNNEHAQQRFQAAFTSPQEIKRYFGRQIKAV